MSRRALVLLSALAMAVAGCGVGAAATSTSGAASSATPTNLTIYAAASLGNALKRVEAEYSAAHPGVSFTLSTGSSAALETQIEQGAPADVFLSADTAYADKLAKDGFALGQPVAFAGNLLTIVVPKANPAGISSPADLARAGVKIIAAASSVPVQKYAVQLVANLARQPGYPADFAARYEANVVSRETDVAAVLAKVALGEGDAGIVYETDAKSSSGVTTIAVPPAANIPATYAGAVVEGTSHPDAARAFLTWLGTPDGQAVLASFGFSPPPA